MLLHLQRGFGCTLLLSMKIQPLGCCFDGFVLRLCLLFASVPGSPAAGRDRACLTLDQVVRCSSTSGAGSSSGVLGPSFGPQFALLFGNWKTSRSSLDFSRLWLSFLPPTAGRSFIGGTSSWSGPLLRVTAISLAFGLASAVFHARVWGRLSSPPSGVADGDVSVPLMLCASTGIYFRSILASSRLSLVWGFSGLVQVFSCLALSVPVEVRSVFSPAVFSSLWFCLVIRI